MSQSIFDPLRQVEPLHVLDDKCFYMIASLCQLKFVHRDKSILTAGRKLDGMYFIVDGAVRLINDRKSDVSNEVSTLSAGDYFGIDSLFGDVMAPFSVYGEAPTTTVLHLPKKSFGHFLDLNQSVKDALTEGYAQKVIKGFMIQSPMCAFVPVDELTSLVQSLEQRELAPGEVLIRQGEDGDMAFIVGEGRFRVFDTKNPDHTLRINNKGDLVGEIALVKNVKRTSQVVAEKPSRVFALPKAQFLHLFDQKKGLHRYVEQIVQERLHNIGSEAKVDVPVLEVDSIKESGAACLLYICHYYEKSLQLGDIHTYLPHNDIGPSMLDMEKAANDLGFFTNPQFTLYRDLLGHHLPAIVRWVDGAWVVISKVTPRTVSIMHPLQGVQEVAKKEFLKSWTEYVLYLKPGEQFFANADV